MGSIRKPAGATAALSLRLREPLCMHSGMCGCPRFDDNGSDTLRR